MTHVTHRRSAFILLLAALVARPLAAQEGGKSTPWEFGFHGTLLMNGFYNDNRVNNTDLPTTVLPTSDTFPVHSLGASVRQTRLIGTADLAGFAGGDLHTELDLDFYGGQLGFGRTAPLLHIRRVIAEVQWQRLSLMVGQEAPLISDQNPVSLATLGIPGYTAAGNLWLWIPQVRAGYDVTTTGKVRFGIDAAVLAPTAGTNQPASIFTAPDRSELSGRPMLEGRVRARWGERGEIAFGGHAGWLATTGDSVLTASGVMVTGLLPLTSTFQVNGEWFYGRGLATLGGGQISQLLNSLGEPMEGSGFWLQGLLRTNPHWEVGAGFGVDDPSGTPADELSATFRDKNVMYGGQVAWRLNPAVVAFEYRHLATTYGGGIGERTATHLNLAMGIEF